MKFLDPHGTRYLPFTNKRLEDEGCPSARLYWPCSSAAVKLLISQWPMPWLEESPGEKEESKQDH